MTSSNQSHGFARRALQLDAGAIQARLVTIWKVVLGEESADVEQTFTELGGDSLTAPEILRAVRAEIDPGLTLEELLEAQTIERLAQLIQRRTRDDRLPDDNGARTLQDEVSLDLALCPETVPPNYRRIRAVLLTGATGFVGAHVLASLLEHTRVTVYCLVRGHDGAAQRIEHALRKYRLLSGAAWAGEFAQRVVPVEGDLASTRLGMTPTQFSDLAQRVDVIFHIAAWVNFTYPYSVLKPTNVDGLKEIVRLAAFEKTKAIHFLSSIAAFEAERLAHNCQVDETTPLLNGQGEANGYAQCKWVGEKLLEIARKRGVPVNIYRTLYVGGHSELGVNHTREFLWALVRGCVELSEAPDLDLSFNITPVDYMAKVMTWLAFQERHLGGTFHLLNPRPLPWSALVAALQDHGYPVSITSAWYTRNKARIEVRGHALHAFVPFFERLRSAASERGRTDHTWLPDGSRTRELVEHEASFSFPEVGRALLRRYFDVMAATGFLPIQALPTRTDTMRANLDHPSVPSGV